MAFLVIEILYAHLEPVHIQQRIIVQVLYIQAFYHQVPEKINGHLLHLHTRMNFPGKPGGCALGEPGLSRISLEGEISRQSQEGEYPERPQEYFTEFFDNFE